MQGGGAAVQERGTAAVGVFTMRGDPDELFPRYERLLEALARGAQGGHYSRPLEHVGIRRDDALVIIDVWESREALEQLVGSEHFQREVQEAGLPEAELEIHEVGRRGWPEPSS